MSHPDPLFPDRPDHPDFWALSEIIVANDKHTDNGGDPFEIIDCDEHSMLYMARQRGMRVARFLRESGRITEPDDGPTISQHAATWVDAFAAGLALGKKKSESTITVDDSQHRTKGEQ